MNLFVAGWNLSRELASVALTQLRQMTKVYPQLDLDTIWHHHKEGGPFATSMHTAEQVAKPRCYVWQSEDQVTFYDGCPVDRTASFGAHDAEALALHWDQLPDALEGQFIVVRLTNVPSSLEVLVDFLGMGQVYYLRQKDGWLLSNSVQLLSRIGKVSAWDPLGVSLFLSVGWAGSDRTLRRDIRTMPGGERWKWQHGTKEPHREAYYPRSTLACQRKPRMLTRQNVVNLADELVRICRSLAQSFGEIECGLTGGRDTRLLTAVLTSGGVPARYFTEGEPSSIDARIATQVAQVLKLPYKVHVITSRDVIGEWDTASQRLIQQTDGMVSLWQTANVVGQPSQPDYLPVRLVGVAGGEIARGYLWQPWLLLREQDVGAMPSYLLRQLVCDHSGLVRDEATELTQSYLDSFVQQVSNEGFGVQDFPAAFLTFDCVRRWAGVNARKRMPVCDPFALFCTRSFVEAAFSISALRRYLELLHYHLIHLLAPKLLDIPYDKGPWRSQWPLSYMARWVAERALRKLPLRVPSRSLGQESEGAGQSANQPAWLEAQRLVLRNVCLDQSNSVLWDFVNRSVFEHVMSDAADPTERQRYARTLYAIATLFYYALI